MKSSQNESGLDLDTTNVFDSCEEVKSIDSIRNPKLDENDLEKIENQILEASEYFKSVLEEKDIENQGLCIPAILSVFLVLFLLEIFRVSYSYNLKSITSTLLSTDSNGFQINTIEDIDFFVRKRVFYSLLSNSTHHYLALVGLKLTLKTSTLIKNPHDNFQYPQFIKETDNNQQVAEKTSNYGLWKYDHNTQGFSEYFTGSSIQDSLVRWREMKSFWLDSKTFISLQIELVTHCRNTFTTSYFSKTITLKSSGKFENEDFCQGFSPEVYSYKGEIFTSILIYFVFLMISYICQLLQFFNRYRIVCKRFITKFDLDMNLYDYLEVILIVCLTITISLFTKLVLAKIGKFSFPLSDEDFDSLIDYISEYRHLIRTACLSCLFSILRLVALMKVQFPSFGVLFETIQLSKNDMVNICFISSILYCGFILSSHIAYGVHAEEFSSLLFSTIELFRSMTGNVTFSYCSESFCVVITLITILFMILFYFVLINLLYAVIISTFYMIKSKDRLLIAAKTEIVMDRTKELFKIIVGFLKFDNKSLLYKEAKEYIELSDLASNTMITENREKLQNIENFIKGQMNISFIQKTKFNLSTLRIFLYESNLVTQEFYIENFKKKIRKILIKEKIEERIHQFREFDVEYNFRLIRSFFCYILLVFFFLLTIILFLSIKNSYEISTVNQDYVKKIITQRESYNQLAEDNTWKYLYNVSELLVISLLRNQDKSHNYLYLNNSIRLSIQIYAQKTNPSLFSNELFPKFIPGNLNFTEFRGEKTKILYVQNMKGSSNKYNLEGGLSFYFNNIPNASSVFDILKIDNVFNNTKILAIEWVTINPNLDFITYNMLLSTTGTDEVKNTQVLSLSISPYFHSNNDKSIIVLITISLTLCCYFFIANIIDLHELWRSVNSKRLKSQTKNYELDQVISKICGSKQNNQDSVVCTYFTSKVKNIIKELVNHSLQVFKVLFIYFITIPFNLLEASSIILTFVTLINLLYVSIHLFEINNINDAAIAAEFFQFIRTLSAINSMILLIQFPIYLQIISRISYLIRIIMSARLDFMFFMLMYYMILFSYIFSGHILMGNNHRGFSTIPLSLFSCYFMQFGQYDQKEFMKAEIYFGIPYIFLYVIIIVFFLTTMFTAIFSGNYQEDTHVYKMTTLEKIKNTVRSRWEGKKVIILVKNQGEEQDNPISYIGKRYLSKDDKEEETNEESMKKSIDKLIYFSELEKQLKLKNIKFTLSELKGDFTFEYLKPSFLPFLNQSLWKDSLVNEKVSIWNGLSIQFRDQILFKAEIFNSLGKLFINDFSDLHQQLWSNLTQVEKIEVWKGGICNEGRVIIWNLEAASQDFFEHWDQLDIKQKISKTKEFITKGGTKQELWKSLPRFSISKLNLLLSLKEKFQYELVMLLCMLEAGDSPIFIEMMDDQLEEIFDNIIFHTKIKMCEYYEESIKFDKISFQKTSSMEECDSLINYQNHLNFELSNNRKKKRSMQNGETFKNS